MTHGRPLFDADALRAASFVRHVELHDTLPSTNDRAIGLAARADLELPALVVAQHQTAGRGRGDHGWWSADGALTFSLILDTAVWGITQRDWPQLSLATAAAVCDALQKELDPLHNPKSKFRNPKSRLAVKPPNDVLLDGRKVCGILIESPGGAPPAKDRLIVGVGINVNNSWHAAPPDVGPNGTALCDVTGRTHDLHTLLVALLRAFEHRWRQLAAGDPDLPRAWQLLSPPNSRSAQILDESNAER